MLTAAVSDPEASEQSSRPNPGDYDLPGGWYITYILSVGKIERDFDSDHLAELRSYKPDIAGNIKYGNIHYLLTRIFIAIIKYLLKM